MKVVFRADGSTLMGQGHVMRCLTLSHALREQGAEISFVCREHRGHLCDLIAERGFVVHRLPLAEKRLTIFRATGNGWAHHGKSMPNRPATSFKPWAGAWMF